MNALARLFNPARPRRPKLRRLADDAGLTIVVCVSAAILITLVNGKTWERYDQMVYSVCIGVIALAVLDGVRLTVLDDPARRRRWLLPSVVLLVATAPVAHYCGIVVGGLILGTG